MSDNSQSVDAESVRKMLDDIEVKLKETKEKNSAEYASFLESLRKPLTELNDVLKSALSK